MNKSSILMVLIALVAFLAVLWFVVGYPYSKNLQCKEEGGTLYRSYEKGIRDLRCINDDHKTNT